MLNHLIALDDKVNPLCLTRCSALHGVVDQAITSGNQSDVSKIWGSVLEAWPVLMWENEPVHLAYHEIHLEWLHDSFRNSVRDYVANLPDHVIAPYIIAFTEGNFFPEREDWIGREEWWVCPTQLWICNPTTTLDILMTMNPDQVDGFYQLSEGNEDFLDSTYGPDSDARPEFKARYAANRDLIRAKYAEFKSWLDSFDAAPPADEISKREVIALRRESARLGRLIELVEHGTVAKNHPLFPKLRDYKAALDHLSATAKIEDLKGLALAMLPFEQEWIRIWEIGKGHVPDETKTAAIAALGLPEFFYDLDASFSYFEADHGIRQVIHDDPALDFSVLVDDIYGRHARSLAGVLPAELFEYEYLRAAQADGGSGASTEIAPDVFALFPEEMSARIKTLPMAGRLRLLRYKGDLLDTPAKFFGVFAENPDAHPDYVIARYQANKAAIDAKYAELIQWHLAQPAE
jgi:hypothetical protein